MILIITGIIMMAYSSYVSIKIYRIFSSGSCWFSFGGKFRRTWSILPAFIIFFLIGYTLYLVFYLGDLAFNYEMMTSLIFFFGALFVMIIVSVNHKVFVLMGGKRPG